MTKSEEPYMKKIAFALTVLAALAGCSTAEQDAALGAGAGALIGAAVTGDAGGAAVGAVVGGASAVILGRATRRGYCRYRDPVDGSIYEDRCPAGY
jgi:hypothetical protein